MVVRLLISFLLGLGSHSLYKPTANLAPRWGLLCRYAIGSLVLIPVRLLFMGKFRTMNEADRMIVADVLAMFSVGAGVLAGHWLDK